MAPVNLKIDWCTHEAAKYAVEHWHYSRCMPKSKLAKFGAWEDGKYIGCVIYGLGATPNLCKPYGLTQHQCCELVRIALRDHRTPVSRIVAIAMKMLKQEMPGLRLVVSFADPEQGHIGGVYKAGGWIYSGKSANARFFKVNGKVWHPRSVGSAGWMQSEGWLKENVDPRSEAVVKEGKHRYLMPLDDEMRARILPLSRPYPKRAGSADSGTAGIQPVGDGATPIPAL